MAISETPSNYQGFEAFGWTINKLAHQGMTLRYWEKGKEKYLPDNQVFYFEAGEQKYRLGSILPDLVTDAYYYRVIDLAPVSEKNQPVGTLYWLQDS